MNIKEQVKNKRKGNVPLFYLLTIMYIIAYSLVANLVLRYTKNIELILGFNRLNIIVTYVWITYNVIMLIYAIIKKYHWEFIAFCTYYILINSLNLLNNSFRYYSNDNILFGANMALKAIEVGVVVSLIAKKKFS